MSTSLIDSALQELEKAFSPLFSTLYSEQSQRYLLDQLGFPSDSMAAASLETAATSIVDTFGTVRAAVQQPATSLEELMAQAGHFVQLIDSLDSLATMFVQLGGSGGVADLTKELVGYLFGTYLSYHHAKLYRLLVLLEIVEDSSNTTPIDAVVSNGVLVRYRHSVYQVHFDRISALLTDPRAYFKAAYYPQGLPNRGEAHQVADKLFPRLGDFLSTLGFDTDYGFRDYGYLDYGTVSNELMKHTLTVQLNSPKRSGAYFGFTLALSSAEDGNLGLVVAPYGAVDYKGDFGRWVVEVLLTATLDGLSIGSQGVLLSDPQANFSAAAHVERTADEAGNAFFFGALEGTYLAIGQVSFQAGVQTSDGQADYSLLAKATQAKFVLRPEEGDGFLSSIIPTTGVSGAFDLGLGWSKTKGFYLLGGATLKAHYTITNTVADKLLVIRGVDVGLMASADKLSLSTTASGRVKLGPVAAELTDIGAQVVITFPNSGGNLGVVNADIQFKYPTGVAIEVASDLVTGGGYLFLDPVNHRYAGAANLTLKTYARDISLNALGLLQTQLPGKPDEYSLLLLITAQFSPIELGLGFTLNGVGGLVGVNRAADTDYLRGMVRRGEIKRLLFPANVLDDPAGALSLINAAFPATEGRYIIGLLGELGWGTPNLITLDVALLLEFPAPLKVLLLGVLQVMLPDERANTLKLRADFLGFVDFGAKKASFDAALSDSHILSFTLTGDMAFRLYQGTNPLFVITAGGFHPAFQPPVGAALTGLRRLTLTLSNSDNLQLTLASYFAVTSNTVQFGSHLDLYLRISHGLRVEGHFGFDVLFQFQPFRVLAHVEAGVAIKSGSHELLSLHLSLDVTGPGPWHVWGEASFRILFIKISFDVNATIGRSAAAPALLPAPNVHEQLAAALKDPTNWAVEAPKTTARPGGVTLRPANATGGELFIDPRGALVVRQRVVPLGVKLEKYGSNNVAPTGGQRFDLLGIILGDNDVHDGSEVETTKDFFAPDQYRVLTDGQKLSLPSFQNLANGLRINRLTGLKAAAKATRRIVEYEQKTLTGTSPTKVKPDTITFQKLAQGSTLGRAVRAEQPSARASKPVGWTEDTYEVVNAADLSYYDIAHQHFGSQVEAEQYRLALADAAELMVVPSYQLALA
jgi:hypothetical protein